MEGPPPLPKPRRGAAVRVTDLLGKLTGCPFHADRREAIRRWLAAHAPEPLAAGSFAAAMRDIGDQEPGKPDDRLVKAAQCRNADQSSRPCGAEGNAAFHASFP